MPHPTTTYITPSDIVIGEWTDPQDGARYRAACVGECVLTGPEHAGLSDADLLEEAWREAIRAEIAARCPTPEHG